MRLKLGHVKLQLATKLTQVQSEAVCQLSFQHSQQQQSSSPDHLNLLNCR